MHTTAHYIIEYMMCVFIISKAIVDKMSRLNKSWEKNGTTKNHIQQKMRPMKILLEHYGKLLYSKNNLYIEREPITFQ